LIYEVKRNIKWRVVLSDVLVAVFYMMISAIIYEFQHFWRLWGVILVVLAIAFVWRMQSSKIAVDDAIYFKRLLLRDLRFDFKEILEINFYDNLKSRPFAIKKAFLEIDTKKKYYVYYLDHFDLSEIKELLIFLSTNYGVKYEDKH